MLPLPRQSLSLGCRLEANRDVVTRNSDTLLSAPRKGSFHGHPAQYRRGAVHSPTTMRSRTSKGTDLPRQPLPKGFHHPNFAGRLHLLRQLPDGSQFSPSIFDAALVLLPSKEPLTFIEPPTLCHPASGILRIR